MIRLYRNTWQVRRSLFLLCSSLCSLCLCGSCSYADLDPELNKPYRLEVVLRIAKHRLLTDVFKDRVERDLTDSLRAAFGELAQVTIRRDHPRLKEIDDKGLQQALDAWKDVDGVKTHFVLIDYVDGHYVIRSRQHDGLTGQSSPVLREERLADPTGRELVARTVALMIDRDFGIVGTITQVLNEDTVKVTLKGGGLGVTLDRWVKKDEVFALTQISQASTGYRAKRVEWALLRATTEPVDGVCTCKLFARYLNPLGGATVAGVRCLKLATLEQAPLKLQLVQTSDNRLVTPPPLKIQVRRSGFRNTEAPSEETTSRPDGSIPLGKTYSHVALVSVLQASPNRVIAQLPVPLLDESPVVCSLPPAVTEAGTTLTLRKNLWVNDLSTSFLIQNELLKEFKGLLGQPDKLAQALEKAKAGHEGVQRDIENAEKERGELEQAARTQAGGRIDLAEGDNYLKQLRMAEKYLRGVVDSLEKTVKEEQDPKRKELQAKFQQAQIEEKNAEFEKAIELYEEVVNGGLASEQLKKHLAQLKEAWTKDRGEAHKRARDFIYKAWPTADLVRDKDVVKEIREAFEVCRAADDKLSPQKLLRVTLDHAANLKKELAGLQQDINEDDQKAAQTIDKVVEELKNLIKEVTKYLQ